MSKEEGKASVFRTTKVRTRLRDDSSWLQQRQDAQAETEEEKPWLAEVRARRLNGDIVDTSPVSSPTTSTPPPTKTDGERASSPGFLIRGVFTKLDKPASPVTTNGVSATTTQFTHKPSESYKKIAPYTVRATPENQEDKLSNEELEKRTEAAGNVLKQSAVRQRSYVLSAAKKFESQETTSDTSLVNSSPSFVAKRVEISDEGESAATPAPASTTPPSPVVPVTSAASAPEPKAQKIVDTSVKTAVDAPINKPVAPKVENAAPEPVKKDPPPVSVAVKDPVESLKPKPKDSYVSGLVNTPLVKLTSASPTPISPTPASPAPASTVPPPPAPVPAVTGVSVKAEPEIAPQLSPKPRINTSIKTAVDATINKPVAPKVENAAPEPVKKDPPPVSVAVKDPVESLKPKPKDSDVSGLVNTPLVKLTSASPTPISPTPVSPAPASTVPPPPAPVPAVTGISVKAEPEITPQLSPKPRVDTSVKTAVDAPINQPVAPKVENNAPEPVKKAPPPVSVVVKDPVESLKPKPKDSDVSGLVNTPLVKLTSASPTPISPTPASPAPASTVPPPPAPVPAVTGISVKAEPEIAPQLSPKPRVDTSVKTAVDTTINKPVAPKVENAAPEPVKKDPPPVSVVVKDPVESLKPKPKDSDVSGLVNTPLVKLTSASPTPISPTPASPAPASTVPPPPAPVPAVTGISVKAEPEIAPQLSPKPRSNVDTLTTLSDTLISFGTSSTSPEKSAVPVPPSPGRWSQDLLGGLDSKSTPAKTSSSLDLLANDVIPIKTEARSLSMQRMEKQRETVKETQSSTETVTVTTKTVIITDKSKVDTTDPWSSHVTTTVTESSSADPFDPYPIGTTSSNSASDLLKPLADISINSVSPTYIKNKDPSPKTNISSNALESLADNVIPISTDSTRPSSQRSWARTWETSTPQQENLEDSEEDVPGGQTVDQETIITFERKSKENDSPWDRWTSPTVYTVTTIRGEEDEEDGEEEPEESPEDTQSETVTTITTIREIHSNPQPAMDRYETYSRTVIEEEDRRVQTPEPEAKKGFVYVKEYVNATELSLYNARDAIDGVSDYQTSSFASSSYSSPSFYSSGPLSSACTFCGKPVDGDAKITIEHLNINCHPTCFKCGLCSKPMGDLLDSMFLHGGKVHCESCYSKALD
ncbi:zinc finger protein 185 isoform X2 [Etheostoma spectabile]|uniref:zinc finger protein 185 isoform X2 n=1 Tax=Etheostoma spectabile TaxID=54343 RepID=UPI0013AF4897|nr:zinc finger protein 185 isoform X2 [Etheostoma spectabile]